MGKGSNFRHRRFLSFEVQNKYMLYYNTVSAEKQGKHCIRACSRTNRKQALTITRAVSPRCI
ncbi:hypothetical protein RUMCAL_02426 [Ruminococcus callidus ATCC 27760]|uniref:Uncharacterized protein n=1 Tax=Ruminococcus callidus ATCC 27760 TaxID=411473 RepID=U2K1P8_9FIRM|nr:hypothetical protein RUMCAL_02426 [Ruminococcus callidus ATCC 27760]